MYKGKVVVPQSLEGMWRGWGDRIIYYAKWRADLSVVRDAIRGCIQAAFRRGMQQYCNMIVNVTLPNNPHSLPKPGASNGSLRPNKQQVNKLRQRILDQVGGTGKQVAEAYPNWYGRPILKGPNGIKGSTPLPIVVPRKYRGRPSKGRKVNEPDKVLTAPELEAHIAKVTYRREYKHQTVRQVKAQYADTWVWASKSAWKEVATRMSRRAGTFVHGWESLAQAVGSNAVRNGTLANGLYTGGSGYTHMTQAYGAWDMWDDLTLASRNTAVPARGPGDYTVDKARYSQAILDRMGDTTLHEVMDKALGRVTLREVRRYAKAHHGLDNIDIRWT